MERERKDGVVCPQCHTGMKLLEVKKYSGKWGYGLIVGGIFCCLFVIGSVLGIPMILAGLFMGRAREVISHCPNCEHYFKVRTDV